MSYTNLVKLKKTTSSALLVQLTNDNNTGDIITEVIDDMIADADAEIDGYLKGRYPDGIDDEDLPQNIKRIANDIVIYRLYCKKMVIEVPKHRIKNYEMAIKDLKEIQKGNITPFESGSEPTVVCSNKTASSKFFNSTVANTYYNGYERTC